jgi:hypothetical protein
MATHPQVIPGSLKAYAQCPAPSARALHQWSEIYPCGRVATFREVLTTVKAVSGTVYGLTIVEEVAA